MSNFLLFLKRLKVFLKYRFLTYKFRLLRFLGKFIPHFKPMKNLDKQDIVVLFDKTLNPHISKNKGFLRKEFSRIRHFDYTNKECIILYNIIYQKNNLNYIDFQIAIKVENEEVIFGLFDESDDEKIYSFYKYLQKTEDKNKYVEFMNAVKDK